MFCDNFYVIVGGLCYGFFCEEDIFDWVFFCLFGFIGDWGRVYGFILWFGIVVLGFFFFFI